uniref:C-type lectin domain-containing protein n=1 Tax=Timema bartmani TaxID=61472 RepID=A0A7R9F3A7_9NEOP|nr:unnamed protein product [Timema bartmani]
MRPPKWVVLVLFLLSRQRKTTTQLSHPPTPQGAHLLRPLCRTDKRQRAHRSHRLESCGKWYAGGELNPGLSDVTPRDYNVTSINTPRKREGVINSMKRPSCINSTRFIANKADNSPSILWGSLCPFWGIRGSERRIVEYACWGGYHRTQGQRITTIQLDGTQYFVSRMNPYSPELNYFLAYQYCRSLGLQLASFETKEKADSITQYLRNAGMSLGAGGVPKHCASIAFSGVSGFEPKPGSKGMFRLQVFSLSPSTQFIEDVKYRICDISYGVLRMLSIEDVKYRGCEVLRSRVCLTTPCFPMPGYNHYDFWTSGNRLGTDMLIWMSSGLPFNATFNYMRSSYNGVGDEPAGKQPTIGDENIKVPAAATGRKSRVTKVKPTQTTAQPTSSSDFASTTPPGEPSSSSNLTVNRRATLRPAVPAPTTLPSLLATLMSETDEEDGAAGQEDDVMENLASRAFPLKEAGANVVYVTAVGVKSTPGGSDEGAASTTGDGWTATTDQI